MLFSSLSNVFLALSASSYKFLSVTLKFCLTDSLLSAGYTFLSVSFFLDSSVGLVSLAAFAFLDGFASSIGTSYVYSSISFYLSD
jgi:hypothetical protein